MVSAGSDQRSEDLILVGDSSPQRIINLQQWRGVDSTILGIVADRICEVGFNLIK